MHVFKCQMCNANLEVVDNSNIITCEYCGTAQVVPKANDSAKQNLENFLIMAKTALEAGNWAESIRYATSALNKNPTSADAWLVKMAAVGEQIQAENYADLRLKEIKTYGDNAITYSCEENRSATEHSVCAIYENCFLGYLESFHKTLLATEIYFKPLADSLQYQYTVLQSNIANVKKIYVALAEMSADIPNTPNIKQLVKSLYFTLLHRLTISQERITYWHPQFRHEQEQDNKEMASCITSTKPNLLKSFPEVFDEEFIELQNNITKAQKQKESGKKLYLRLARIGVIVGPIGLIITLITASHAAENIGLFMLGAVLLSGFGFSLAAILALPWMLSIYERGISLEKKKLDEWTQEMKEIGYTPPDM